MHSSPEFLAHTSSFRIKHGLLQFWHTAVIIKSPNVIESKQMSSRFWIARVNIAGKPDMPAGTVWNHADSSTSLMLGCVAWITMRMPFAHSCAGKAEYPCTSYLHHIQPSPRSTSLVVSNVAAIILWLCANPASKSLQRKILKWLLFNECAPSSQEFPVRGVTWLRDCPHACYKANTLTSPIFLVQRTHAVASACCSNSEYLASRSDRDFCVQHSIEESK